MRRCVVPNSRRTKKKKREKRPWRSRVTWSASLTDKAFQTSRLSVLGSCIGFNLASKITQPGTHSFERLLCQSPKFKLTKPYEQQAEKFGRFDSSCIAARARGFGVGRAYKARPANTKA